MKVFADELRRGFGTERNFTDQKSSRPTTTMAAIERRAKGMTMMGSSRSFTTEGICITMKSSDLAKEQVLIHGLQFILFVNLQNNTRKG